MSSMNAAIGVAFTMIIALVTGCSDGNSHCSPDDFMHYMADHVSDLSDSRQFQNITFSARYLPNDLRILQRFKASLSNERLNEERENLKDYEYYQLRIGVSKPCNNILGFGVADKSEFERRLSYYHHDFASEVRLVSNSDTIDCAIHQFIGNSSLSNFIDFLVAFPVQPINQDRKIMMNDVVFNKGVVVLKISGDEIEALPKLIIEEV